MATKQSGRLGRTGNGGDGVFTQLSAMLSAMWASPVRNSLILFGSGIFALIIMIAVGQVMLNRWNVPFYDALSRRNFPAFLHQLLVFIGIAGTLLVFNVSQTWLNQMFTLKLREGLARDLVGQWMVPGRAFGLDSAGEIGDNPDQRLHEDARHLAETSCGLGINLLQSTVILVSFVGVLWTLSSGFVFHVQGYSFSIPGYMVWAAVFYAGSASLLTWFVGRSLVNLNAERYGREAELRSSLMRVHEHIDSITLAHGEADENRRLDLDISAVLAAIKRIVLAITNLTWITGGYGWFTIIAPILVAAPVYFSGGLSFGGLMMAVGAFTQVHNSLRWFVDNFGAIADWRATLLRVASFRQAILRMDELEHIERQITLAVNDDDRLTIDDLSIAGPVVCLRLQKNHLVVLPGERVLVTGGIETERTLLFRTLGGLWHWGEGRIGLPAGDRMVFLPRRPYFPPGDLRTAIVYPQDPTGFSDDIFLEVLRYAGLERLFSSLDLVARWERILTEDEQQCLAFARLLLQKPRWVILDGILDGMDAAEDARIRDMMRHQLKDAAIINIGKQIVDDHMFSRVVYMETDPLGEVLELPSKGK